jgi:hypothetical protein
MAVSINHDMDQGADFTFGCTAKDASGLPMDISSGYTAYCQMRRYYSSTDYTSLVTSITGATGDIVVSLGATHTAAIKQGIYFYDVELHGSNSTVKRVVQGMITVYPEVTRF